MGAGNLPELPERSISLLSLACRCDLDAKKAQTEENNALVRALLASASPSVPEFLDAKYRTLEAEIDYLRASIRAMRNLVDEGKMSFEEYRKERDEIEDMELPKRREDLLLEGGRKIIEEDVSEDVEAGVPLETAYANLVENRVAEATGLQPKKSFDKSKFRRDIIKYYAAAKWIAGKEWDKPSLVWCHLLGWMDPERVRASHIVPKSLSMESLSFLFGSGVDHARAVKNGLTLARRVEMAMDNGDIVIVPVLGERDTWKCVVTVDSLQDQIFCGPNTYWRDIHDKRLEFRTPNRPGRRYLYFRYLITYLHQRRNGNTEWTRLVETKGKVWASPGRYLARSTLQTIAKQADDGEWPELLFDDATFSDDEDWPLPSRALKCGKELSLPLLELAKKNEAVDDEFLSDNEEDSMEYWPGS